MVNDKGYGCFTLSGRVFPVCITCTDIDSPSLEDDIDNREAEEELGSLTKFEEVDEVRDSSGKVIDN